MEVEGHGEEIMKKVPLDTGQMDQSLTEQHVVYG